MRLARQTLVAVVSTALVAAVLTTAPASAQTDSARDSRSGHHFPVSVTTKVPPGGYSTITSPTIPKDAETLEVKLVARANATQPQVEAFDELATVMGQMTKGKRLLVCVMLYNALVTLPQAEDDYDADVQFQANEALLALVALVSCVRLAGLVTSTSPPAVTAGPTPASREQRRGKLHKCVQDKPGVPGTVEQGDGGWTLTVDGVLKKARNKLKVGCRTKSGKTVLRIRAAKKGVPLRKVMGKQPRLSLVSPADAGASAPTKVTFSLP